MWTEELTQKAKKKKKKKHSSPPLKGFTDRFFGLRVVILPSWLRKWIAL